MKLAAHVGLAVLAAVTLTLVGFTLLSVPKTPPPPTVSADFTPAPVAPAAPKPNAVFIGDSWVGGSEMGGNGWRNFAYILAGEMGWRFVDDSKGGSGYVRAVEPMGTFSSDVRIGKVKDAQPTYTFVVNGINDWQERISRDQLREAAASTYDKILAAAPNTKLVVIGMMAPGAPTANTIAARDVIRPLVEERGGLFIDPVTDPWWDGEDAKYVGTDKYHLTDEGHVFLAKKLEGILREALKLPATT